MLERFVFAILLLSACGTLLLATAGFFRRTIPSQKFANTASALLGLASMMQLKLSGWFESVMKVYGDAAKFPYGPPSNLTRNIIDDPDHPIQTWIRNTLYFDPGTGAYLAVAGIVVAIVAIWIPDRA